MEQVRATMIGAIALGIAAFTAISIAAPSAAKQKQSQAVDKCREAGEQRFRSAQHDSCAGVWNIYASIKGGWTWWSDKTGDDGVAHLIDSQAKTTVAALKKCGIDAHISLSDWFDQFSTDLVVVHSAPHSTREDALAEIIAARKCKISGYSKSSRFSFAGRH